MNVLHFRQNGKVTQGRVMTTATINVRNKPRILFYTVMKNNNSIVQVYPENVVPHRNVIKAHIKNKIDFDKLKRSIATIKELQNLPSNVRKIILGKINKKLAIFE